MNNSNKIYDLGIVIGRMQILHNGHYFLIHEAFKKSNDVIVLLGSAQDSRTKKNPFTAEERGMMIDNNFLHSKIPKKVLWSGIDDYSSDDYWKNHVFAILQQQPVFCNSSRIALFGHKKDGSSYYLDMFSEWNFYNFQPVKGHNEITLNATELREMYFSGKFNELSRHIPSGTRLFLNDFRNKPDYNFLCNLY